MPELTDNLTPVMVPAWSKTFRIPTGAAIPEFYKRMAVLNDRANRAGLAMEYVVTTPATRQLDVAEVAPGLFTEYTTMTVTKMHAPGAARSARFVARVNHIVATDGQPANEVHLAADVIRIPGLYAQTTPYCDHCQKRRKRRLTFIVGYGSDHKLVQLGAGCVDEYLGRGSLKYFADLAKFETELDATVATAEATPAVPRRDARELGYHTAWVVALALRLGYPTDGSIRAAVGQLFFPDPTRPVVAAPTADELTAASDVYRWLMAQTSDRATDEPRLLDVTGYQFSLAAPVITSLLFGAVAVVVQLYKKSLTRQRYLEKHTSSTHQSAVGTRLDLTVAVVKVSSYRSYFGSGLVWFVTMTDAKANLYSAYCSRAPGVAAGQTVALRATVKEHRRFAGVPDTRLTRVKFSPVANTVVVTETQPSAN